MVALIEVLLEGLLYEGPIVADGTIPGMQQGTVLREEKVPRRQDFL
jgi:hypothetical protein